MIHKIVAQVTRNIELRSEDTRKQYLDLMAQMAQEKPTRGQLGCTNLAHVMASQDDVGKLILKDTTSGLNVGILTAYNDMLSAHQPYYRYPEMIKQQLYKYGISAQVAGGVPAMCDGVTQGYAGMELSLFSRDAIALSTAVGLSHQSFDAMVLLGICDKIVPGLLMGALRFGHLPAIFLPAGPMATGISNSEKAQVRQAYVEGKVGDAELLESEVSAYHSPGTCTFYGTANSNQMLLEAMGLMLPGSAFEQPDSNVREKFNEEGCEQIAHNAQLSMHKQNSAIQLGHLVNAKSIVNAIVALLATGGSSNLTIHWIAIAKAAGIQLTWQDMHDLSQVVPLICKVYPNGSADINAFHKLGGTAYVFNELLHAGLMHGDVLTTTQKTLAQDVIHSTRHWQNYYAKKVKSAQQKQVLATVKMPFDEKGGLTLLSGNIGQAIIKVSAVKPEHRIIRAQAKVFLDQLDVIKAFQNNELNHDVVVILKGQGPKANGMPELHKLMPVLGSLQDHGFKVALLTDGRLSGASGKVLSAIHCVPEAAAGGFIDLIHDGDTVVINAETGEMNVLNVDWHERTPQYKNIKQKGVGRELFSVFRKHVTPADKGAISIDWDE
ncbi:phosphogluconate dehydratase [Oceaniserpentilla sp. 4NH20-0058]|uniref:phosphogluconate dehydratase n=1 Tax=Oceaniserpentilla sp. 4NH20-0058 TaxID=3127660 RepID=UPI003109F1F2